MVITRSCLGGRVSATAVVTLLCSLNPAIAQPGLERYEAAARIASDHIDKYRTADFDVFTNQLASLGFPREKRLRRRGGSPPFH